MKKNIINVMSMFLLSVSTSKILPWKYTFNNNCGESLYLAICKATCNCQVSGEIKPGKAFTFYTGGCCLDYLEINAGSRDYQVTVRPGQSNGNVSLPQTGAGWLCRDYQGTISVDPQDKNKFILG
ncbi:MAG: hypothetical protein K2X90_00470 [Candidatus Babeliaceae bacterium]|nr:hypothetical protein [Candidatus Babeliaceae bacterium]